MLVELDDDMMDKVFADSLLDTYKSLLTENDGVAIFSKDKFEENIQRTRLCKSIQEVHDWYSAIPLQQRLKSEKALQELHNIDQELGLYENTGPT